jgi:Cu/Ag efflux protein CusF
MFQNREIAMIVAKTILAATAALIFLGPAAFAQQTQTGMVSTVDRINRTVSVRLTQSGTSGANTGTAAEQFKAQDGLSLDTLHAGDKVTFSTTEKDGIKTITSVQKQ